jgi:hypothetical protein
VSAPKSPTFDELMAALARGSAQLEGAAGKTIRKHVERLGKILEAPDAPGLRDQAAAELDQLIRALAGAGGAVGKAFRGVDAGQLADGLRTFAGWLRSPSKGGEEQVAELMQRLGGPVPLSELRVGNQIDLLAIEAARRKGLEGEAARHEIARMKREVQSLMARLERFAQDEASRARTANSFEQLLDRVLGLGTPLSTALRPAREQIVRDYRRVDLAHMAEGLRELAEWLASPHEDPDEHVEAFQKRLVAVLGPATLGDPNAPEAERRAALEAQIQRETDRIFNGPPEQSPA